MSSGSNALSPIRLDPRFDLLRAEMNRPYDLTSPSREPNWPLVEELAERLHEDLGADFLVVLWLILARTRLGLWAGLADGLDFLSAVCRESWLTMEPPPKRLASRQSLLRWWESQTVDFFRAKLSEARPLDPAFSAAILAKLTNLSTTLARLEPSWEPGFWSLKSLLADWPAKDLPAPPKTPALVSPPPPKAPLMATPLSPPIVIEPQTNFWRPLALILLALILLIPWLLDLRLDDLIALWPKTLDSNVAPPPPSQTLTLTKKNQDPSLGLNFLALKAQPESVGPCPKGQGDGEILAAFARPVSFNNLWVYLSYRGAIGTYVTQSELEGPKPVTAVDFAGRFRILGPAKTPLTLGPARSLAVGLHPGFVRVAINYPPDNIPLAALTEVYCFKPKTSFGLNLLAISLTLTPPRRLSDYF